MTRLEQLVRAVKRTDARIHGVENRLDSLAARLERLRAEKDGLLDEVASESMDVAIFEAAVLLGTLAESGDSVLDAEVIQ